ncbi:MAG: hypothetical protein ACXW30_03330 [Micavibrio sp.]
MLALIHLWKRNDGYNLLQMAIALLIIGVLSIPLGGLYFLYEKNRKIDETHRNVESAMNAVQGFRKMDGYFPCPAPLNVDRSDPTYGNPTNCRSGTIAALTPGTCADGVCVENSVRATLTNRRVLVGAIPFRLMQIEEDDTIDAYGSRLVYAVTESLTDEATFNEANGAIAVRDGNGQALTSPDGAAAYLVLSPGANRVGAYSVGGALGQPCGGAGLELENCNIGFASGTASSPDSIYVSVLQSDAPGAGRFDDVISYFSEIHDPVWRRTTANPEDIQDLSSQNVGIGTSAPATALEISSTGDSLRAYGTNGTDGKVMVDLVCDQAGTNCFDPAMIGGDVLTGDGMECPIGQYMTGIENGAPKCDDIAVKCTPALPVLVGIDPSTGAPVCRAVPLAGCGARPVTACTANDITLPAAGDTFVTGNYAAGACRTVRYRCNAGTWGVFSASGQCSFTPTTTTTTGIACGPGYTGTYTTTTTTTCLGGNTTTSTAPSDCTCVGGTVNETVACNTLPGFSAYGGNATRVVTYTPPSCAAAAGPWDTSACTCTVPSPSTRWVSIGACPPGYSGGPIEKEQNFDSASCGWVDTGNINNPCTCNTASIFNNVNHVCTDPVCEEPDPADKDIFRIDIDPATCTQQPPVLDTPGSCKLKAFKWIEVGTSGSTAATLPPGANYVGTGCSCADHVATSGSATANCFYSTDPTQTIFSCKCN